MRYALVLAALLLALIALQSGPAYAGSTFVVDTISDDDLMGCMPAVANDCSMRGAINKANLTSALDTIEFDVGTGLGAGPIVPGLNDGSGLPDIMQPVFINGETGGATKIELNGFVADFMTDGLRFVNHTGSTVQGMDIGAFTRYGIAIVGGGGHLLQRNNIGINAQGTSRFANAGAGVYIEDSTGNQVGGDVGNIISGNGEGIRISDDASGNFITGNLIGTNGTGTAAVANDFAGIVVFGNDNTIGTPANRNVISGNGFDGVNVAGSGNTIENNLIGTDATGSIAIPNTPYGVRLVSGTDNTLGSESADDGNLISGNAGGGVLVNGGSDHRVIGNKIGTNADGTMAVPNIDTGVLLFGDLPGVKIGEPGSGNLISGNSLYGVAIGPDGNGIMVSSNVIGLSENGSPLRNGQNGVQVYGNDNTIGGPTAGHRNVISGHSFMSGSAILITNSDGGGNNNTVTNNYLGTNVAGNAAVSNHNGVRIVGGTGNQIGLPGAGNLISGNTTFGVWIDQASGNTVQSNIIGPDATGTVSIDPPLEGIQIEGNNNFIGGPGAGNLIRFNLSQGVFVLSGTGNTISQNRIYENDGGAIDLAPIDPDNNDDMDSDTGANNAQNFPLLTLAEYAGDTMHIVGSLNSNPNTDFTIEFFWVGEFCSPDGYHALGREYAGSTLVTTDGSGDAQIDVTMPWIPQGGPEGYMNATATHEDGSTSETQACQEVTEAPATPTPTASPTPTPSPTASPGPSVTATPTPGATGTPTSTATPTPTGGAAPRWGDSDCDGAISSRDNQALLRAVLQQNPLSQTEPCPDLGTNVDDRIWGDWDCDGAISSRDNQALLRSVLQQTPLSQTEPCPDIGAAT